MVSEWQYMPILKWKQGEQLALKNLTPKQWVGVTPLIELQPIDAAPDAQAIKSQLKNYINNIASKINRSIPSKQVICVDTCYVSYGYPKQIELLMAVIDEIEKITADIKIVPVIHASLIDMISMLGDKHKSKLAAYGEIVLRIRIDLINEYQILPAIKTLEDLGINKHLIHILIDQYSIVSSNDKDRFDAILPYIETSTKAKCSSITISGGSFPMNLIGIRQGISDIPRIEWKIWKRIQLVKKYHELRYSDYAVTNPAPLPDIDATAMNPSIAIRYTATDHWRIFKGKGFKSKVPGEYRTLCKLLTQDTATYSGENFSYGDRQYKNSAGGGDKNGNPSSWRKEATSHHIVFAKELL